MLYIVAFLIVISVLILVHEFGHFFAAKSVDIQVPRFSLGLGPRVAGFRIGETEFVLSAIPLGGYVKMAGMEDDEAAEALEGGVAAPGEEVDPARTFDAKPLWARAWVISAGVIMNLIFAFLVFVGLGLAYGEVKNATTRLYVAGADTLAGGPSAELRQIPVGARVEAVGQTPVESWDDIEDALAEAPAGPVVFRLAEAPPVSVRLPAGMEERARVLAPLQPFYEPVIAGVVRGRPAAQAGFRAGDRVVTAAGKPVRTWQEFESAIRAHPGKPLAVVLDRGGRRIGATIVPETERELNQEMKRVPVGKIGVQPPRPEVIRRSIGPAEAVTRAASQTWESSRQIVVVLGRLVTGAESMRSLGGPLAIGQLSGETARLGASAFLGFMALFSINLAVFNLLPIPILDGGHLLFILIEAVRGRPLSLEQRIRLSHVGMIFVVGLMVWAITNDLLRFVFNI